MSVGIAQNTNNQKYTHDISLEEIIKRQTYQSRFEETMPPDGAVRNIAEWEPMEAVLIAYQNGFGIPESAIAEMTKDCKVIALIPNEGLSGNIKTSIEANGGNVENLEFVMHQVDGWWTRDYTPWFIAVDNEKVAAIDFPYNRPRPNDDIVPKIISQYLNIPLFGMNITQTGGNYMTDGYGIGTSTDLVVTENILLSEDDIRKKMKNYLGIEEYLVVEDAQGEYIKHIDCWGKLLSPDKILIAEVPQTDPHYNDYEAVAQIFKNQDCSFGYPYKVIRVKEDPQAGEINPYSNSLILNKKVFLPISGSHLDAQAIKVYEDNMPGYKIVPVKSDGWFNTDALHCRTHGIANREMLYINHMPISGNVSDEEVMILADVYEYTIKEETDKEDKTVTLNYKVNDDDWTSMPMAQAYSESQYVATLNLDENVSEIKYYISAEKGDKKITNPINGKNEPYSFSKKQTMGINENIAQEISIYPNPTRGKVFFKTNNAFDYQITDNSGKVILNGSTTNGNNVDLQNLPAGLYLMKIKSQNNTIFKKIIKR